MGSSSLQPAASAVMKFAFNGDYKVADQLFAQGKLLQAISLYQQQIEVDIQQNIIVSIHGLGNHGQTTGYYQWFIPRWFAQKIKSGQIQRNAYDALSLCYAAIDSNKNKQVIQQGISWYRRLKRKNQKYQILQGYANILYNKGDFDAAIRIYKKIIDINPKFITAYESIAMTYEYKRIDKKLSCQYSNKILQKDSKNMWALFILARNQKSADEKIQKLKTITKMYPKYARAFNQIGILNGGTKKFYDQAIKWYQKAAQVAPQYASCYNNIGINYQLKKQNTVAIDWYFRAIQRDAEYKAPYLNAIDVFKKQSWDDQKILASMAKYPNIKLFFFCFQMGLAYYDNKQYKKSIKWYDRALQVPHQLHFKVYNSKGVSLDDLKQYEKVQKNYQKCISLNASYHTAYYNMAIVHKNRQNIEKAIQWYKKAIQINPIYSFAYNNLANIYKQRQEIDQAIKYYRLAAQSNPTYTLALVNLGVCLFKIQSFKQAFQACQRASRCLPNDSNNLSQSNKLFLQTTLANIQKQKLQWKIKGFISNQQKTILNQEIKVIQGSFKLENTSNSAKLQNQRTMKKQIIEIISLLYEDKFELDSFERNYHLVKELSVYNKQYFHILPQILTIYHWKHHIYQKKMTTLQIGDKINRIIANVAAQQINQKKVQATNIQTGQATLKTINQNSQIQNFNLFEKLAYFNDYGSLCNQIDKINNKAKTAFPQLKNLVETISNKSNGLFYEQKMKISQNQQDQFLEIMSILHTIFEKQMTKQKINSIIQKIDNALESSKQSSKITTTNVINLIKKVWTQQVTFILQQRKQKKSPTYFNSSDLVSGRIVYKNEDDLIQAVQISGEIITKSGYKIIGFTNRLDQKDINDFLFKIKINESVCELQFTIKQDQATFHLIDQLTKLQKSPLGMIFASYLYMTKRVNYPFIVNCKDIIENLKDSEQRKVKRIVQAAQYIVDQIQKNQENKRK